MSVQCLGLADFLLIAERFTEIEIETLMRQQGLHRAEYALAVPTAGIGQTEH